MQKQEFPFHPAPLFNRNLQSKQFNHTHTASPITFLLLADICHSDTSPSLSIFSLPSSVIEPIFLPPSHVFECDIKIETTPVPIVAESQKKNNAANSPPFQSPE